MRRSLVVGNWKMHGSLGGNEALLTSLCAAGHGCDLAVCVPFPYLGQARAVLAGSSVVWGAQTLSQYPSGAYTGEVSAGMLAEFGCEYVIVGHSERRALFGETDSVVAAKFCAALDAGLKPILCLGETLEEREAGQTEAVVDRQLQAVLASRGGASFSHAVLAYEPVWAIGTGRNATPEQAQAVHAFLRARVASEDGAAAGGLRILYGGSVKSGNAAALFGMPDIDGGLVGGASLVAGEFLAIAAAAVGG